MSKLIRTVARELRYRSLPGLAGARVLIQSIDTAVDSVLAHLEGKVVWPLQIKGPKQPYMTIGFVKYGILDLTFTANNVIWSASDAPGLSLLENYGFLERESSLGEGCGDEVDDPTCLTELSEDIQRHEILLRLFLSHPDPDYMLNLVRSGVGQALIDGQDIFEDYIRTCLPQELIISDACVTNADFIWFHKHFYL